MFRINWWMGEQFFVRNDVAVDGEVGEEVVSQASSK